MTKCVEFNQSQVLIDIIMIIGCERKLLTSKVQIGNPKGLIAKSTVGATIKNFADVIGSATCYPDVPFPRSVSAHKLYIKGKSSS